MPKDAPLAVDVPSPSKDSPGWVKVGVIAAVGFIIGVAWPRAFGVRLGPSAPGEAAAAASASAKAAGRAPDAPAATVAATGGASVSPVAPAPSSSASTAPAAAIGAGGVPQIHVQKGAVLSCKTDEGDTKKGRECGAVSALDMLVATRLKKLATCGAAEGQTGKLSFMVNADFASGRMTWDIGKSSTVGNTSGLQGCLKTLFQGVGLQGVAHEHPKYNVAFTATLSPGLGADKAEAKDEPASKAKDEKADEKKDDAEKPLAAGAEAAVGWEVALVRDTPKTGQVVARLPRGSKVKVGSAKDGWYAIKFGEGFASDGWVYRGAIGR